MQQISPRHNLCTHVPPFVPEISPENMDYMTMIGDSVRFFQQDISHISEKQLHLNKYLLGILRTKSGQSGPDNTLVDSDCTYVALSRPDNTLVDMTGTSWPRGWGHIYPEHRFDTVVCQLLRVFPCICLLDKVYIPHHETFPVDKMNIKEVPPPPKKICLCGL